MSNPWFTYPICVPFGNPNYDSALGGSHDMDLACPPNYPVTALLPGTIETITSPSWGRQVGIRLDSPYHNIPYLSFLHLSAVSPSLRVGSHVVIGELIGWAGGATQQSEYAGTSNPTGSNFLNDASQSSRVQVGIALMRGPEYGVGPGWEKFPPVDHSLDPTSLIKEAVSAWYKETQFNVVWHCVSWAYDSGICKGVRAAVMAGKIGVCYPTHEELRTVNTSGASIQLQTLSNSLRAEWDNHTGACHIFDCFNRQVA